MSLALHRMQKILVRYKPYYYYTLNSLYYRHCIKEYLTKLPQTFPFTAEKEVATCFHVLIKSKKTCLLPNQASVWAWYSAVHRLAWSTAHLGTPTAIMFCVKYLMTAVGALWESFFASLFRFIA